MSSLTSLREATLADVLGTMTLATPCPVQMKMVDNGRFPRQLPPSKEERALRARMKQEGIPVSSLSPDELLTLMPRWDKGPARYPRRPIQRPTERCFVPVRNGGIAGKPKGGTGMWTSTYLGPDEISDWVRWSRAERFPVPGEYRSWLLMPDPSALVIQIDSVHDMEKLDQLGFLYELYPTGFGLAEIATIDHERLARLGISGVQLTEEGQWRTRFPDDHRYSLYGWDSESTIWLRWAFVAVREGPRIVIDEEKD